ncbi:MAG TPA: hypothetical protein DDY52_01455 [Candidatus Moranbacteria bacterium]|nr:hypothetical protein [Candidatus Moranbacteria bacterium]
MGKLLTIENTHESGTFYCRVTGVSEYIASMGREVTLSVSGLNINGEQIGTVSYQIDANYSSSEQWQVIAKGRAMKVRISSIE